MTLKGEEEEERTEERKNEQGAEALAQGEKWDMRPKLGGLREEKCPLGCKKDKELKKLSNKMR